jgi:hypothetical protein
LEKWLLTVLIKESLAGFAEKFSAHLLLSWEGVLPDNIHREGRAIPKPAVTASWNNV